MTYEEFATGIGKEVAVFLKRYHYDGKKSKDSFWLEVTQSEVNWLNNKYRDSPYALHAAELISAIHNVIELETRTIEEP